jgi:hypothetical protein
VASPLPLPSPLLLLKPTLAGSSASTGAVAAVTTVPRVNNASRTIVNSIVANFFIRVISFLLKTRDKELPWQAVSLSANLKQVLLLEAFLYQPVPPKEGPKLEW